MTPFVIYAVNLTRSAVEQVDEERVAVTADAKPTFFILAENPSDVIAKVVEIMDLDGRPTTCEAEVPGRSAWTVSCCERHDYTIEVSASGMGVRL